MGIPGLNVKIGVSVNVVIIKPCGYAGTIAVLFAPEPVRLVVFQGQKHSLMNVERPPVITGEIIHVRGIYHEKYFDPLRVHAFFHASDAVLKF